MIAGIAVLLLAMGVGILIGHNGSGKSGSPQVISVAGGGAAPAAAAANTTASSTPSSSSSSASKSSSTKPSSGGGGGGGTKVVTTVKNLPPPQVNIGQAGSGKGYQNGHFTGNFFGN